MNSQWRTCRPHSATTNLHVEAENTKVSHICIFICKYMHPPLFPFIFCLGSSAQPPSEPPCLCVLRLQRSSDVSSIFSWGVGWGWGGCRCQAPPHVFRGLFNSQRGASSVSTADAPSEPRRQKWSLWGKHRTPSSWARPLDP